MHPFKFDWPTIFKMPAGFAGKLTVGAVVFLVFCMSGMALLPPDQRIFALVAGAVGFAIYVVVVREFSRTNPILAALDGASAVAYYKQEIGAKNPKVIEGSLTPVAGAAAPSDQILQGPDR